MTTAAACDAACAEKGAGCWRAAYYDGSGGSSPSDGSGGGGGGDCQLKVGGLPFSLGLTAVTTIIGTAAEVGIAGRCLFKAAANPSLWAQNMIAHAERRHSAVLGAVVRDSLRRWRGSDRWALHGDAGDPCF